MCVCGVVVTFNVGGGLNYANKVLGEDNTNDLTEESIREFIKVNGTGCTDRQVKFITLPTGQQLRATHIRQEWFPAEII